jgi:uncharacterized protein YdeI (YjbR/CyaY-like superfamily)
MATLDPRIDAYIENSAEFARPILLHLREAIHAACPDVEETMKWGRPHFMYHGMLCGIAAFKQHCVFGFWKHELVVGDAADDAAMGQFGSLRSLKDLPSRKVLAGYIKKAMKLNEEGTKLPSPPRRAAKKPLVEPDDFLARLKANRKAKAAYEAFSPSHRREYVEWITEAKREETRERRLAQAIEWLAEGKSRNWKYENC